MTLHSTCTQLASRAVVRTPPAVCRQSARLTLGILMMLATSAALANICGESASQPPAVSMTTTEPASPATGAPSDVEATAGQHGDDLRIEPSELLGIRHGAGFRVVCKRIDGVDTQVEHNFVLEDIWPVETSDGNVLISAWEADSTRQVVRSARIELDLSQPADLASRDHQPVRRANAARCRKTATGRCSSPVSVQSSVRLQGNRFRVEQATSVNGARTEWVVWLLER